MCEIVSDKKNMVIDLNIYQNQMDKLTKYWSEKWSHNILWETLVIPKQPKGLKVLEYEPCIYTEDQKLDKYKQNHGENLVWCYYHTINLKIKDIIKIQGVRPSKPYLYWHAGGQEPDDKYLGESYTMFDVLCKKSRKKFAIPTEGITIADRYRLENGEMIDIEGSTLFHALDLDDDNMYMSGSGVGSFRIRRDLRSTSNGLENGPREISF